MKKILIGNDINLRWLIKNKEEQPVDLSKSDVLVKIIHQELPEASYIPLFSVDKNEISLRFPAEEQKHLGIYHLQLILKDGNTLKIVNRDTFCLSDIYEISVHKGTTETNKNIEVNVLQVENEVSIVNGKDGKSAYEVAVSNGFEGTEPEWLDSLKADINDQIHTLYNSDGTLTSARTVNTGGKPLYIKGLPDKSSDSSFTKVKVQNDTGQEALSNGKTIFKNIPSLLSSTEKNTWLAAMNNLTSFSGTIIRSAGPSIIKRQSYYQNIVIYGSGLNLIKENCYVGLQLPDKTLIPSSNIVITGDTQTIIAEFLIDGTFPLGEHKVIVLNAGVPAIGDVYIQVVDKLTDFGYSFSDIKTLGNVESDNCYITNAITATIGNSINITPLLTVATWDPVSAVFSNALPSDSDWILSFNIFNNDARVSYGSWKSLQIGLTDSKISPDASPHFDYNLVNVERNGPDTQYALNIKNSQISYKSQSYYIFNLTFTKINNVITIVACSDYPPNNNYPNTISQTITIDTIKDYKLKFLCNNYPVKSQTTINITQASKF